MKNFKNIRNIQSQKKQQGLTLIESMITITLLVGVILLVTQGWPLARDYWDQYALTKRVTDYSITVSHSCQNGDCSNVTTARVLASGNLKEYHNSDDTAILSISGVAVEFAPANIGGGTDNGLSQTHENITQRVCNLGVKSLWGNVALINVDGVGVKTDPDQSVDEDAINTNCTSGFNQIEVITQA